MMIPRQIEQQFPASVRERGARYHGEGRVRFVETELTGVIAATVKGSAEYQVVIELRPQQRWRFVCTCPFAEDNYHCKHMWAVLLAADARGLMPDSGALQPQGNRTPEWKRRLHQLKDITPDSPEPPVWPENRRIVYYLDVDTLARIGEPIIEVKTQSVRGAGSGREPFVFTLEAWLNAADARDREIAHLLHGARPLHEYGGGYSSSHTYVIPASMYATTLRAICETGRLTTRSRDGSPPRTLGWDEGAPWSVRFHLSKGRNVWQLDADFERGEERRPVNSAQLVTAHGLVLFAETISRYESARGRALLHTLVNGQPITVPNDQLFDFMVELVQMPDAPELAWPAELSFEQRSPEPIPRLTVKSPGHPMAFELDAKLSFDYDGQTVSYDQEGSAIVLREERRIVHRQSERERAAAQLLHDIGVDEATHWRTGKKKFTLATRVLPRIVESLCARGWHVEADGKHYRASSQTEVRVSSGIDWFELQGSAQFGAQQVPLPQLLSALRKGEKFVVLDDGTLGLLPTQWLERFVGIAQLGSGDGKSAVIRFTHAQTALLDALLASLPEPSIDETFERMRNELARFDRVEPVDAVTTFNGTLRPYQREGLGWMNFLRRFALGGCLADDMGLGKTVQVLALLEQCRVQKAGPALIVVPASLVFNWKEEAARFAPALRVRDYTGLQRRQTELDPADFDVLLTTYGTLRRDAPALREIEFDTIVLDEAQAIKNAKTASAKAARLLRGRHRLALSGTPIENRLEELWSLFDFLNPGMLGASTAFATLRRNTQNDNGGPTLLARALRPFLLRRTKEQVAPELPPRIEQTLMVELEPAQRALYNELRDHYRNALLPRVDKLGIKRVQIEVLEALLRLRQAACHTALIDDKRAEENSAKLDVLADQLTEVVAEGHKALVFSQFTSFLSLVQKRLDDAGLVYEYLDGKTRNRQERVERFQSDPACPLFLISLRAGGYGLNLTAADYVFVLDPWWNPAVEAQAIDRTHRIGQERPVLAVRLIARDTVEEKVLELQRHKRALADAILGADAGGLAGIGREELELLLG